MQDYFFYLKGFFIMNENIVVLEQLPIITERLAQTKQEILDKTQVALSLECNSSNYKEVKKVRADLKKDFDFFENKRKEIKKQILEPYEQFQDIYKENISSIFKQTDENLKAKIDEVEQILIDGKKAELNAYFLEYTQSLNIDFVSLKKLNLKINMSTSLSKLKDQCNEFLDKIVNDLSLINSQEYADEIRVEYKYTLDLHHSISTVTTRKKALKHETTSQIVIEEKQAMEQATITKVEETIVLEAPRVVEVDEVPEELLSVQFKVTAPLDKLKALKGFLIKRGYQYESI